MSTPRQECPNCHSEAPAMQRIVRNSVCTDAFHYPKPEGVAAPLEPATTCLQAIADYILGFQLVDKSGDPDAEMIRIHNSAIAVAVGQILDMHDNMQVVQSLNEFAAAVSKNLQEELARLKSEVAVRDEWLRFADAEDLKTYRELRMRAGKSPR